MKVSIKEHYCPSKDKIRKLSSHLRNYNNTLIGEYSSKELLVELIEGKTSIGGIYAIIKLGWLYIDLLWVNPSYRKRGYGKLLLETIEQIAVEKYSIKRFKLNTGDFQGAFGFYKYHGYQPFAELEVFPENADPKNSYIEYYMKKIVD